MPSKRIRSRKATEILSDTGKNTRVYELTGELGFSATEVILSQLEKDLGHHDMIILSLRRVSSVDQTATRLIAGMMGCWIGRTSICYAQLGLLMSLGEEVSYKKGDYLCRAGDISTNLYFILSGYVSIMLPIDPEREQRIATFDAGAAIGEFSVVDKRPML